jgi:group II intron reverse transcriptase/maturase
LNTQYGNGASVVVRARENLVHGEGKQLIILMQLTENVRDMKRSPEKVLNSLSEHSENLNYKFERLYRILFNEEMYYAAYQRIYAKPGNMTAGADGQTIDQMSLSRIDELITSLKDESYQPQPSKRVYIPKKNGKMRPLGVPAFNDKLVQEVTRMILESIYEGQFEKISHGFRPQRSCHTALSDIDKTFGGVKWFVEGDIKGFFDNINHEILIGILKERIADERFIRLIRKFLNAGYIEDWHFHNSYSGTPQGGIVSPILANIYLDKLDKYMKEYTENFDKGKKRKANKQAVSLEGKKHRVTRKLKMVKDGKERSELVRQLKAYQKETLLYSYGDEMDKGYRKIKYVRYADDFLIGIIGDKQDAIAVKEDVKNFLNEKLDLELSEEKTLITHSESSAKFLGYEISVRKSNVTKRNKNGDLRRPHNKRVVLKLGKDMIKKKLLGYQVLEIKIHNGQELWKAKSRPKLSNNNDFEILDRYNKEIRGMYNYYCMADNCNTLSKLRYIMLYSMYKTFAQKYRTTMSQIRKRYTKNRLFSVKYYLKNGVVKDQAFYHDGFKKKNPMKSMNLDNLPKFTYYAVRPTLADRLRAERCELCGAVDKLMMHHVRKLKNLKGDSPIEKQMIARKRKTIAICSKCQKKLSNNEK